MRFLFGDHVLDTARRELSRGGEQIELEPQVFDLLVHLLRNRERVVSKDDLLASGSRPRRREPRRRLPELSETEQLCFRYRLPLPPR